MKTHIALLCSLLALPVAAQDAPNPALYEVQNRNAAVLGRLVDQTVEYQEGYSLRLEAAKQREAAHRAAALQQQRAGQTSLGYEDQAAIDNLNSDLNRVAADKKASLGTRELQSRALRDQQRQIYERAGVASPIAAEPPPRPIIQNVAPAITAPAPIIQPPPIRETYRVHGTTLRGDNGTTLQCYGGICR